MLLYIMLTLTKINKKIVQPIALPDDITKPLKGHELFPRNYPNIFICSKKFSGKTTVIFNILKETASKRTQIIIFSSTIDNDVIWKSVKKYFKSKGINIITYSGIIEDGNNQLEELTNHLMNKAKHDNEDDEEEAKPVSLIFPEDEEEEAKPRKEKTPGPEFILVFDDLSNQLQNKSVEQLLKRNRHLRIMTIISSQYYNDLTKQSRTQLDFILMFKNLPDEKLDMIHKESDLSIDLNVFKEIYKEATKGSYNFMWCDLRSEKFRKNFNLEISI